MNNSEVVFWAEFRAATERLRTVLGIETREHTVLALSEQAATEIERLRTELAELQSISRKMGAHLLGGPVPMVLSCPRCCFTHVDGGEWTTKPHKTHLCIHCRHEWRPFPFPTVGIAEDSVALLPSHARTPSREVVAGAIAVLRGWRNDGADGESAHLVCDELEAAQRNLDAFRQVVRDGLKDLVEVVRGTA